MSPSSSNASYKFGAVPRPPPLSDLKKQQKSHLPKHLSRVLYFPKHNESTSHLPIYDISQRYSEALGKIPFGSRKYKIELALLWKPRGTNLGDVTRFLVDVNPNGCSSTVRERCIGRDALEADISLPSQQGEGFRLSTQTRATTSQSHARLRYPMPDKTTKHELIRYPYLTISHESAHDRDEPSFFLEWQVHLVIGGPMRYDLIDLEKQSQGSSYDDSIVAVFHHCGFEPDLPSAFSEGILLLPEEEQPMLDVTAVSSLFGLLHSVRKREKRSRMKSIFRRFTF
ncbi:hypothetical protein NM208_g8856 [Fusarium decemcellulare]|uniref:Uncharacterized protein n=1 Tax=Fusarium decemcellulare TaxID=57161 RepID=A0ACC1S3Z0_9HYPO|nr:hypothetical protein NM208_g8856 [Fusarium decemcellulare]